MLKKIAIALVALFSCFLGTQAQEANDVPSVNDIDTIQFLQNVVVYGNKPYGNVIPSQMLKGKQLERLNSHSVADAVRYFAGVQLKD